MYVSREGAIWQPPKLPKRCLVWR